MRIKECLFLLIAFFVTFFLDGQLTFFLSGLGGFRLTFSSHLFLLMVFYGSLELGTVLIYTLLLLFGLFYDSHYLLILGPATIILPLLVCFLRFFTGFLNRDWGQRLLGFLFLVISFEVLLYGLARLVGLTSYPVRSFLTAQLLPTILINLAYMLGFSRAVERVLGLRQITNEL